MITLGEAIVYLRGESKDFDKAVDDAEKKTKSFASRAGDLLKKGVTVAATGAAAGVVAVGGAIVKMGLDAQNIPETTRKFDALTKSIGTTSDTMLNGLRKAVQGTVNDFDLMQQGNKLMSMGLADSSEEAAKLAEIAYQLGDPTQSVTANMENLALMLANQSIPRLDSFGISGAQVKAKMEELQASQKGMSRETAFMTAFMEQADVSMKRVGSRGSDLSTGLAGLKVSWENTSHAIGVAFLPILQAVLTPMAQFAQQHSPAMIKAAQNIATWITGVGVPAFSSLVAWINQNLPAAIAFLQNAWSTVLLPALQAGYTFVIVSLVPALGVLWDWMKTNLPAAITFLKNAWETVLLPALSTIWAFTTTSLIPTLKDLWAWVQENLPAAIAALQVAWDTVLLPAITTIWKFATESLLPILKSLGSYLEKNLPEILSAINWWWTQVIWPGLEKVWLLISRDLLPIWKDLAEFLEKVFKTALSKVGEVTDGIKSAFDRLTTAVGTVWNAFKSLQEWWNTHFHPPAVVTPGSPSPLEIAMVGIARATEYADSRMADLGNTFNKVADSAIGFAVNYVSSAMSSGASASRYGYAASGTSFTGIAAGEDPRKGPAAVLPIQGQSPPNGYQQGAYGLWWRSQWSPYESKTGYQEAYINGQWVRRYHGGGHVGAKGKVPVGGTGPTTYQLPPGDEEYANDPSDPYAQNPYDGGGTPYVYTPGMGQRDYPDMRPMLPREGNTYVLEYHAHTADDPGYMTAAQAMQLLQMQVEAGQR